MKPLQGKEGGHGLCISKLRCKCFYSGCGVRKNLWGRKCLIILRIYGVWLHFVFFLKRVTWYSTNEIELAA